MYTLFISCTYLILFPNLMFVKPFVTKSYPTQASFTFLIDFQIIYRDSYNLNLYPRLCDFYCRREIQRSGRHSIFMRRRYYATVI